VTCHEARELFSGFVDDEMDARERSALDTHLVGCVDCRRELDRFRRTVSLVQALPPERAPAGFVDRVVTRARPAPWPVRLVRGLFVPWTKLPLEAAAILLVGGLAVWVYQQTPEQQQSVRLEQAPPSAEAPAPVEAPARVETPTGVEEPARAPAPVESFTRRADAPATPAALSPRTSAAFSLRLRSSQLTCVISLAAPSAALSSRIKRFSSSATMSRGATFPVFPLSRHWTF